MRSQCFLLLAAALCLTVSLARPSRAADDDKPAGKSEIRTSFKVDKSDLGPTGKNPYLVFEPGYRLFYKGQDQNRLVSTVLDETKKVDGVECRVVEERDFDDDVMVQKVRNYLAVDKRTGDVYFFGQDITNYEDGEVVDHDGSWQTGKEDARFGLLMPGEPRVGDRFQQEDAPGVAEDRSEIVALGDEVTTPAGTFKNCIRTLDSSALEQGSTKRVYAKGVGLVLDEELELLKIQQPSKSDDDEKTREDKAKEDKAKEDKSETKKEKSEDKKDSEKSDDKSK